MLKQAARDLAALKRPFAVVGGIAVSARTAPRTTRDVDLVVAAVEDKEAERICADLVARGYGVSVLLENTATGRLATVRMTSPVDGMTFIDVLFASSGIEDLIVRDAENVQIDGVDVPIARSGHLLAMKVLSNSEARAHKDPLDIHALLETITPAEITRAREAVRLIVERGYGRGKDVVAELEYQIGRAASSQ